MSGKHIGSGTFNFVVVAKNEIVSNDQLNCIAHEIIISIHHLLLPVCVRPSCFRTGSKKADHHQKDIQPY
jgi:hypothetical protein